mmetsp:Transcript_15339/g.24758  ORF Transcript_15339/g.24758 Transcript_15339/m.24758 type:complete len:300 (+) Transcript_15339:636-1535(+)
MSDQQLSAIFYVNVCEPVIAGVTEKGPCADHPDAIAVSVDYQSCKSWGLLQNEQPWRGINGNAGAGVETTYHGPSDGLCEQGRTATLQLKCDDSENANTYLESVTVASQCGVVFQFRSKTACGTPVSDGDSSLINPGSEDSAGGSARVPSASSSSPSEPSPSSTSAHSTSKRSGGFSIFMTLLLVGTFLYCVIGICLNMHNEGRDGLEAVPHIEFWRALPALLVHAVAVTIDWVKNLLGFSSGGSGYHSFPSSRNTDYTMPRPPASVGSSVVSPVSDDEESVSHANNNPRGPSGEYTVI